MIKKFISILLVLGLATSALILHMVFASAKAGISVSNVTAESGETVDVDITFRDNPGIMGATLTVSFDDKALSLVSVKDGGILGAQSHKPELKSPYTLAWSDDTATVNNTSNGVAATLTFKVNDSAIAGKSYPITVSYNYDNYDIYDVDLKPVDFSLVCGAVKVAGNSEQPTNTESDTAQIAVSDTTAKSGETVDVDITFMNNPGIMGATLTVTYDDKALSLISVKDGGILGAQSHKPELKSPYTLAWSDDTATVNNTSNGVAATLTFKVNDSAIVDESYPIMVSYDYDNYDIYDVDLNRVKFNLKSGAIRITTETPTEHNILGDVDRDGTVKIEDATWILRYTASIETPFVINKVAADVNGDGFINSLDATAIQYYLARIKLTYKIGEII